MMRLAFSNLALPTDPEAGTWRALRSAGVTGIEIAPTRIAPWADLTVEALLAYRRMLEGEGLQASSLQALCFGVPGLSLLGDVSEFDRLSEHLRHVFSMAQQLGAGVCVFGSPAARRRGIMARGDAFALAIQRFQRLGQIAETEGAVLGLEPVPPVYGSDFLETWEEVRSLVEAVDKPGVRVHLDTGCVALAAGDIAEAVLSCAHVLCHFHVAEPELKPIVDSLLEHAQAATALAAINYAGWISIEMRALEPPSLETLLQSVNTVKRLYESVTDKGGMA